MYKIKNIIIILSIITFIGLYLFIMVNNQKSIEPLDIQYSNNKKCYIEKGLEKISTVVKPAVINYLTQSNSESTLSRNQRLSLYFSGNSPIYKQNNTNSLITKSIPFVASIKSHESEGGSFIVKVLTYTKLYKGDKYTNTMQTFWVKLTEINDGTFIPYDIGELKI